MTNINSIFKGADSLNGSSYLVCSNAFYYYHIRISVSIFNCLAGEVDFIIGLTNLKEE